MLRNSKNSNSSRSFQSETFQNNSVITSNLKCFFKTGKKILRRLVKKISSPQTNKLKNTLTY